MDAMNELSRAAFNSYAGDSYDPDAFEDSYDPDAFTRGGSQSQKPGTTIRQSPVRPNTPLATVSSATFDIRIEQSNSLTPITIELFNTQSSDAKFTNYASPFGFGVAYAPLLETAGIFVDPVSGVTFFGVAETNALNKKFVAYDHQGKKVYIVNEPAPIAGFSGVTISCKQIPYLSLCDYANRGSFVIDSMRMTFSKTSQIDADMELINRNFLGSVKNNNISPKTYLRPDQFQGLIIDVPANISIDADRGIRYPMEVAPAIGTPNVVTISMFIKNYTRSAGNR